MKRCFWATNCYKNSLKVAKENGIRSVAFPSISTGVYSYPLEKAAVVAVRAVSEFISANPNAFDEIVWVLFDAKTKAAYDKALKALEAELAAKLEVKQVKAAPKATKSDPKGDTGKPSTTNPSNVPPMIGFFHEYEDILNSLPHVFDHCGLNGAKTELVFHDIAYQILVSDIGVPFEYETYYQMTDSKAFDDVDLRVNIDWNGGAFVAGDPNSELDVVASKDSRLISISCKAGKYDQQAIYEVKANADKFGGERSVPVLCVDIDMERPEYVEKARELNVLLIEYRQMREKKAAELILKWMETH